MGIRNLPGRFRAGLLRVLFGHQSCLVGSEGCRGQAGCISLPHRTTKLELLIPVVPRSVTVPWVSWPKATNSHGRIKSCWMKAAFIVVYFLQHWQNVFHGIIVTSEEKCNSFWGQQRLWRIFVFSWFTHVKMLYPVNTLSAGTPLGVWALGGLRLYSRSGLWLSMSCFYLNVQLNNNKKDRYDFNGVKISISVYQYVSLCLHPVTFWHLDAGFPFC